MWLKASERAKLINALELHSDAAGCGAMKSAFDEAIAVYNRPQGDQRGDNTEGVMAYVSVWSPNAPPGFRATRANLVNPLNAFYAPVETSTKPVTTFGVAGGKTDAVSFGFTVRYLEDETRH